MRLRSHLLFSAALLALDSMPVRAQVGAPDRDAYPRLISDAQFDIVLVTPAGMRTISDDAAVSAYFEACSRSVALSAETRDLATAARAWDWTDASDPIAGTLTVLVSRTLGTEVDCDARRESRATAFARGLRVTRDTAYREQPFVREVRLRRGDAVLRPTVERSIEATWVTRAGLVVDPAGITVLTVRLDDVAPGASGRVDDLVVEVEGAVGAPVHVVRIPWSVVRSLWEQELPARLTRLDGALLPAPAELLASATDGTRTREERMESWLSLGTRLAESGDLAAARVAMSGAVVAEPCVTLDAASSASAREILGAIERPADRCSASVRGRLRRALILPGFSDVRGSRRQATAIVVLGVVTGTIATAQLYNAEARSFFDRYNRAIVPTKALELYGKAEEARTTGTAYLSIGVGVWTASVLHAVWSEYRLTQRLRRVQGIRARSDGALLRVAPSGIGLSLTVF